MRLLNVKYPFKINHIYPMFKGSFKGVNDVLMVDIRYLLFSYSDYYYSYGSIMLQFCLKA